MSDKRDIKETQEEQKYVIEILEYYDDGYSMFYYKTNGLNTWQDGYYSAELAKEISILTLNNYAVIFGLPKVKESQITYIETDEIN